MVTHYLYLMIRLKHLLFLFALFATSCIYAQQPGFKLFLVGDAGEDELTGETLDSLKSKLHNNPNSGVVFLGDNSYKDFLFIPTFKGFDSGRVTRKKMMSQLSILDGYRGSAYFVPGNHDWWNKTNFAVGKRKLKLEESFIEANLSKSNTLSNPASTFLPRDGSPGPATQELDSGKVKIVFIDTDWLILLGFKSTPKENFDYEPIFYHKLDSTIASAVAKKQVVIVVAHHPVYATGKILANPVKHPYLFSRVKQSFLAFPSYKTMSGKITAILEKYPGVYYACGHIHALQYHMHNNVHYIISGAGSKTNKVKDKNESPCNATDCVLWNEKGFFEIDFYSQRQDVMMYHDDGKKSYKL